MVRAAAELQGEARKGWGLMSEWLVKLIVQRCEVVGGLGEQSSVR